MGRTPPPFLWRATSLAPNRKRRASSGSGEPTRARTGHRAARLLTASAVKPDGPAEEPRRNVRSARFVCRALTSGAAREYAGTAGGGSWGWSARRAVSAAGPVAIFACESAAFARDNAPERARAATRSATAMGTAFASVDSGSLARPSSTSCPAARSSRRGRWGRSRRSLRRASNAPAENWRARRAMSSLCPYMTSEGNATQRLSASETSTCRALCRWPATASRRRWCTKRCAGHPGISCATSSQESGSWRPAWSGASSLAPSAAARACTSRRRTSSHSGHIVRTLSLPVHCTTPHPTHW
eukprot:PhM_4_TR3026/c5_g2_i1/m.46443